MAKDGYNRRSTYMPVVTENIYALYDNDDNFIDVGNAKYCAEVMGCAVGNIYQKASLNAKGALIGKRYKKVSTLQVFHVGRVIKEEYIDRRTEDFKSRGRIRHRYDLGPKRTSTTYRLIQSSPMASGRM